MAESASQNISLNSTVTVTYAGGNYYSRTSNTSSGSLSFSVSVPSGATNVYATIYYNYNSSYSGAKVNCLTCSQGAGYIHLGAVSSANVSFSFKAFCESYSKGPPTSSVTRTASWSAYLAVTWDGDTYIPDPGGGVTPGEPGGSPDVFEIWNLKLNGVMGATPSDIIYSNAGAAATLSWEADDTLIAGWQIHRKVNGGAYVYMQSIAWQARSATVYAAPAGSMYQYMVLGIYANNAEAGYAYSPTMISRSAVSIPAWCSVSPATRYPGESTTLSWGASSGGVGTSVTGYHIYRNGVSFAATTGTSYTFAAPAAGSYLFQIYAISNVSGYNNGPSPGASLTVINPKSTGVLNKFTVPMDGTSTIMLTVTPSNTSYSHKAVWFLGAKTWTDTFATNLTESTLTVPLDWCGAVPSATSGTASVRLETYNGATLIGSYTYTFTVSVPASVVPTVSLSVAPVTGFNSLYIQGISKAKLTATAAGAQGSTIANYAFTGAGYSGSTNPWTTTGTLNYVGTTPTKVIVTDSRGRQASATVNITVQAYAVPIISSVTAYRSNASGTAQEEGTSIAAKASLIVSPVTGNSGTATVRMRPVGGSWLASKSIGHTTLTILTGTAQDIHAYDVEITLTDTIGKTTVYSVPVPMVKQLYEWKMDRAGIGRLAGPNTKTLIIPEDWTTNINADKLDGKHASEFAASSHSHTSGYYSSPSAGSDLNNHLTTGMFGWATATAHAPSSYGQGINIVSSGTAHNNTSNWITQLGFSTDGNAYFRTKVNASGWGGWQTIATYPVGAIYMSTVSTSPATLFGGTWAALGARFLIGVGTGYANGATGGAATHTHTTPNHAHTTPSVGLTVAQLAAHTHGSRIDNSWAGGLGSGNNCYPGFGGTGLATTSAGSGSAHGHGNTGNAAPTTNSGSSLPPYLAVYMWKRTA